MRLLLCISLTLGLLFGCGDHTSGWPKLAFEKKKWDATKDVKRFVFVRDLIEEKKLIGKSKDDVYRMLGQPEFDDPNGERMTYVIGQDSVEYYVLDIRFDDEKPVRRVQKIFVRTP